MSVPARLCAKIPDAVSDEEAVFAVLASVGLQGIRLANPTAGEPALTNRFFRTDGGLSGWAGVALTGGRVQGSEFRVQGRKVAMTAFFCRNAFFLR